MREAVEKLKHVGSTAGDCGRDLVDAIVASHQINRTLGGVGKKGGLLAPRNRDPAPQGNLPEALANAQVDPDRWVNPAYTLPAKSGIWKR